MKNLKKCSTVCARGAQWQSAHILVGDDALSLQANAGFHFFNYKIPHRLTGDTIDGPVEQYADFLETAFPRIRYSGHHICNHLIAVNDINAEGELYAIAYHVIPNDKGGWLDDSMCVRYLDHYRRDGDGRWRFAKRQVIYDMRNRRKLAEPALVPDLSTDPSFEIFKSPVFTRGARA